MKWILLPAILFFLPVRVPAQDGREVKNPQGKFPDSLLSVQQIIIRADDTGWKDTAAADKMLRMAIAKALKANDFYSAGKAYLAMGEMYFQHKNHNKSLGGFINAKDNFNKASAGKDIALANFKLGRAQYYRGNYKLASRHLTYAMRSAKQLKLTGLEADVLEYMGILYHAMPRPGYQDGSLLKKSLRIKQQLKDQKGEFRVLGNLAMIYYDQQKFDSALYYGSSSLALAEKLSLKYDADLSRLNLVPALLRLNRLAEANEKLFHVKKYGLDSSDLNVGIRYHIQAGNINIAVKDISAATKHYDTALHIAQDAGFPEMYALVYKNMAGAYYYNDDFKKAYEYQVQYADKMAGLYSQENFATIKELEYILNAGATKDEVKYLSVQNEIKEVRLKDERLLVLVLSLSAAGFLLSAGIIYYLYRKQKRKSLVIEKQSADLQTLIKEIHHRVKNNLQVISSMLDLQSLTINDKQAAEAIKDSRNRVQTMALIHQDLYNENNIRGVAIDIYIQNLAQRLFHSYNIRPGQVILKADIEKISLDVDTVIPIGLVLNELISNSLKYAFDQEETGVIEITLKRDNEMLLLQVKDNGKGFPLSAEPVNYSSFGLRMIRAFANKLKAGLDIYNDNGACVSMKISKFKIAA